MDVCVLTETHLSEGGSTTWKFQGLERYAFYTGHCCDTGPAKIRGGVAILVNTDTVTRDGLLNISIDAEAISRCSIFRFLGTRGIYIPPYAAKGLSTSLLDPLVGEQTRREIGHILRGDFNTASWAASFPDWVSENGMWELPNPDLGTFSSGNALDCIFFVPGDGSPTSFL